MGVTMRNVLIAICFCLVSILHAQDYRTHKVQSGETIEEIAKQYLVTPFDILALNPDAKTGLSPEMVLIIPKSKLAENPTQSEERQLQGFEKHKVKKKETLYSIARLYNVSVDDIKKHNKRLYSENLRKGDRIQIPKYKVVVLENPLENTIQRYIVRPKEGKWRIAYKFGITIAELEALNPGMNKTLQVGEEINVPNLADNEVKEVDDAYGYYTVLPKEGYYRLKLKLGLTQEELETLNPELTQGGLKAGMVLKVPKDLDGNVMVSDIEQTSLVNNITNLRTKRLAVMLPFRLHRIDLDSIAEAKDIIQEDNYVSIALDFHSGVLMALDSAKYYGISSVVDVYDTRARVSEVSKILSENDFSQYDAVIGPFTSDGFDRTAQYLRNDKIPVISAVIKPKELYGNVYQTIPNDDYLRKRMINYIKADSAKKQILIISDAKNKGVSDEIRREFSSAKQIFSHKDEEGRDAYYVLKDDIELQLKEGLNVVFLETANEGFISNVTSMLSALNGITIIKEKDKEDVEIERNIILVTTDKNRAFDSENISNIDLSSLKFHFPSVNRSYDYDQQNNFVSAYLQKYSATPNRYAVRGFDLTMDLLLRLASKDDLYEASNVELETEYIENKFRYNKKLFGGYYNEAAYIVRYEDLKIVEAKQ